MAGWSECARCGESSTTSRLHAAAPLRAPTAPCAVACYRAVWEVLAMQGPFGVAVALGDEIVAMPGLEAPLAEQARLVQTEALTRVGATEGIEARLTEALGRVRAIGDRKLETRILGRLGNICLWAGRVDEARRITKLHSKAHAPSATGCSKGACTAISRSPITSPAASTTRPRSTNRRSRSTRNIGSRRDEAITLCNLADLLGAQGFTERARQTFSAALALLRELGDRDTEAVTLQQLGEYELSQGLVDEAMNTLRAALELSRVIGNTRVYGQALRGFGDALLARGEHDEARSAFEQALAIARTSSNRRIEANCIASLGDLALCQDRHAEAAALLAEAETLLREIDDRPLLADLLCTRGLVDLKLGDRAAAQAALSEARQVAADMHVGEASTLGRAIERLRTALAADRPARAAAAKDE